jgi:hypothetical protein
MIRHSVRSLALVSLSGLVSLVGLGCSTEGTSTPVAPTAPVYTTENFTGTIQQTGVASHPFTVAVGGTLTMGLTSVAPLATMAIGVGIGSWDGTTCTALSNNDNSKAGVTALSGSVVVGSYCARVYDSGNIPAGGSATYTLQVVHP